MIVESGFSDGVAEIGGLPREEGEVNLVVGAKQVGGKGQHAGFSECLVQGVVLKGRKGQCTSRDCSFAFDQHVDFQSYSPLLRQRHRIMFPTSAEQLDV